MVDIESSVIVVRRYFVTERDVQTEIWSQNRKVQSDIEVPFRCAVLAW